MNVQIGATRPENLTTDLAVFGVVGRPSRRSRAWAALLDAIGPTAAGALDLVGFSGKPGDLAIVPAPAGLRARVLAVGSLGSKGAVDANAVRRLMLRVGDRARTNGLARVACWLDPMLDGDALPVAVARAAGEGLAFGGYRFATHLGKKPDHEPASELFLAWHGRKDRDAVAAAASAGWTIGNAQNLARDLVNEPANVVHPRELADRAIAIAKARGIAVTELDKAECEQRGMGAFLAVGQGGGWDPVLVHLAWKPEQPRARVALVGKALTFDSGGLCLKPADSQPTMKMDMGGSAAVIATIAAAAELKLPVEIHAIFAACENMTGSRAFHTGDILRAANGKTIEVLNTDAEGRLTLADALHYAAEVKPDVIVDLATLTGACMVALGMNVAGIMGTGRALIRDLRAAGDRAGEPMWELPMPEEYGELIKSKVADLANLGGRWGGAITAGMFLKEFVPDTIPWAHIDIAGPCFVDSPKPDRPYGGTGFPVRALVDWLSTY